MYFLVKEIMTVTRFHLVKGLSQEVVKAVKDVTDNSEYLEGCDELDWDGTISYEVEDLGDDLGKDLKLRISARHIEDRLSEKDGESTLTPARGKPIVKRRQKTGDFDALSLLEDVK